MKHKLLLLLLPVILFTGCATSTSVAVFDDSQTLKTQDYYTQVGLGSVENVTSIHKFGSSNVGTDFTIISQSKKYMTPTTPVSLEFVSTSTEDSFLGTGARQITITGLDSNWEEQTITINTAGTTPVQIPSQFLRVYRWHVSSSGTYASPNTTSYVGDLEIRETGNGDVWTTITYDPITSGQSQIGAYSIPKGKSAYLTSKNIFADTTKSVDIYFFFRENADDITAPFSGTRRIIEREVGFSGGYNVLFPIPKGPFVGPADIGFFGAVSQGTADISVEFELLLIDTP